MENRSTTKNVTIGDKTFQINKADARTGCWLFTFLGARQQEGGAILSGLGKCTRSEFDEIQTVALSKITILDNQNGNIFPIPLISPNGSFSDKSLETDSDTIMRLTTESILLDLVPFLVERGSNSQIQEK